MACLCHTTRPFSFCFHLVLIFQDNEKGKGDLSSKSKSSVGVCLSNTGVSPQIPRSIRTNSQESPPTVVGVRPAQVGSCHFSTPLQGRVRTQGRD